MNYGKTTIAGLAATAIMSLIIILVGLSALPTMNFATLIATLLGIHVAFGWVVHFAIGIFWAMIYALLVNENLPVISNIGRGIIYSILLFVLSSFAMLIAAPANGDNALQQNAVLALLVNLPAYFAYGALLGFLLPRKSPVLFPEDIKGAHPVE
jgi:hypothetical protein